MISRGYCAVNRETVPLTRAAVDLARLHSSTVARATAKPYNRRTVQPCNRASRGLREPTVRFHGPVVRPTPYSRV